MLYQWEVGRLPIAAVRETFWLQPQDGSVSLPEAARAFAFELAEGVVANIERIDPIVSGAAEHWRLERMNVIDRLILRLAVFEFLAQPATPAGVVIDEALELARAFSGDEAVRFVNGVLDTIRRTLDRV